MVRLQNIIYPQTGICVEEALFFRRYGEVRYCLADEYIELEEEAMLSFDTYFNGFSASKWYKYTKLKNLNICLKLQGKFRVSLLYKEKMPTQTVSRVVDEFYCDTAEEVREICGRFPDGGTQGMYTFNLMALEEGARFYAGFYYTQMDAEELQDVSAALIICTYRREKYVYKNMRILEQELLENDDSELTGRLRVFIADNAKTLDGQEFKSKKIHVFPNKNAGGAGGFTRGLLEALRLPETDRVTHVLLMDDDVVIQPESIYRTYRLLTMLKPEYKEAYVGGAMLRTDAQWFQTESGGYWNNGQLISRKSGLDLRILDACLYNEWEEKCDYNAWFYCAMPMEVVREDNLPLPIFIRGDDVEYGLRNMKHLILMNGICVWHEPFENKYSSSYYYYIFRNKLIDNAVRNIPYTEKQFRKEFGRWFMREVFTLRYRNAWLLLDGANDFFRGIDWMKEQDGEEINRKVMEKGYRLEHMEELPLPFDYLAYQRTMEFKESKWQRLKRLIFLNGIFLAPDRMAVVPVAEPHIAHLYRAGAALNYDFASRKGFVTYRDVRSMKELYRSYRELMRLAKKRYEAVKREWQERAGEITNGEFWRRYLGCEAEESRL